MSSATSKALRRITQRALEIPDRAENDVYVAVLAGLQEDTQEWWTETLACKPDDLDEGEEQATANVDGLRRFIECKVLPWFEDRRKAIANHPLLRDQAFGESLDPEKLERLGRYEVHLDRKLERMLSMLLRLKNLRQGASPD